MKHERSCLVDLFGAQKEDREREEAGRQQRRAAKMQAARKAAIEALRKKREEKRRQAEVAVKEEMVCPWSHGVSQWYSTCTSCM